MRRFQCLVGLFAVVAFAGSCAHDDPSPTAPLQVEANLSAAVCRLLTDDFMDDEWAGSNRLGVERRIDHIRYLLKNNQQAQAQTEMFQLWDLVLKAYYAGKLPGGTSAAAQKRVLFIGQVLYCFVGLDATGLTLSDPSTGDLTQVVFPATTDQDLVHGSGNAGVRIYGSTLTAPVTISITAITAVFNPYAGPLNTPLDQYGPYFHFGAVPNITFANPVLVEECLVGPTGNLPASVDLAHNVGTGVEILPKATDHLLTCTTIGQFGPSARELWDRGAFGKAFARLGSEALALIRPSVAWAGGSGVSGKPRNFSPFGGVDTLVTMDAVSATSQSAAVGTAVATPPQVKVHTNSTRHASLAGASVTFTVTAGGGTLTATQAGSQVTTVNTVTDANGTATVAMWTLGATAGPNTVSASAAFPPPPTGSNVAVTPTSVQFSATGTGAGGSGGFAGTWAGSTVFGNWAGGAPPGTQMLQVTLSQANGFVAIPSFPVAGFSTDPCLFDVNAAVAVSAASDPAPVLVIPNLPGCAVPPTWPPLQNFQMTLDPRGRTISGSYFASQGNGNYALNSFMLVNENGNFVGTWFKPTFLPESLTIASQTPGGALTGTFVNLYGCAFTVTGTVGGWASPSPAAMVALLTYNGNSLLPVQTNQGCASVYATMDSAQIQIGMYSDGVEINAWGTEYFPNPNAPALPAGPLYWTNLGMLYH